MNSYFVSFSFNLGLKISVIIPLLGSLPSIDLLSLISALFGLYGQRSGYGAPYEAPSSGYGAPYGAPSSGYEAPVRQWGGSADSRSVSFYNSKEKCLKIYF